KPLGIAVAAGDRTGRPALQAPALRFEPDLDARRGAIGRCLVRDNAALADMRSSNLELRLEQSDQPGAWRSELQRMRQHLFQADETGVADDQRGRFAANLRQREIPRVGFFE